MPETKPQTISTMPAKVTSSVSGKGAQMAGGRSSGEGLPVRAAVRARLLPAALGLGPALARGVALGAGAVAAGGPDVQLGDALAAPLSHVGG